MRFARNLGLLPLFVVLLGITFTISSGCGSSGHPVIAVLLSTAPPNSLQTGANAPVAATVMNDSANKGVTWSCMPAGSCGSFNPTTTASGAMTTFTAPQAVPQGGSVTIIATSVSDNTKTASAMVTITAPPAIVVTFGNPAPPASIDTSAAVMIAANVTNDPANKGVTWSCVPTTACGPGAGMAFFNPTATTSGTPTTFTAPSSVNNGMLLIITATSVSDNTKFASANVALSAPATETVTITQFPAQSSLATGANAMFGATIAHPAAGEQVNWSCTPNTPMNACGSFNPTTTASGAATTYTAPPSVPAGNQVNIIATSSINNVVSPSVVLTIFTAGSGNNNARLKGQFAFSLNGQVTSSNLPTIGSLTFDGNGNITSGEFDQPAIQASTVGSPATPVTGTYGVGNDGRGSMTLSFLINGAPGGQMSFNFALTSNSHAVLAETDTSISASGSLDLQSAGPFSASQVSGGYSFALAGEDPTFASVVRGGIFTADGVSAIKNGIVDSNLPSEPNGTAFTGTFTAPDTFGRGTMSFTDTISSANSTYTYYIVTPGVLRLVETDFNISTAGGSAYGQGSAANFSNASLSGNFVFGLLGQSSGLGTAVAGQFTTDNNGNFTAGVADSVSNDGASLNPGVALTNSTYSFTGSPRGSVSIVGGVATLQIYLTDPKINLLDPNNASGGGGALIVQTSGASSVGLVIPQAANPASSAFTGNYAVNVTALQNLNPSIGVDCELDLSGAVTASGGNSFSGMADFAGTAFNPNPTAPAPFSCTLPSVTGGNLSSGSFTADPIPANAGHFTGAVTVALPASASGNYFIGKTGANAPLTLSYYQATSTQIVFIQTDGGELAIGFLEQ